MVVECLCMLSMTMMMMIFGLIRNKITQELEENNKSTRVKEEV